MPGTSKPLLPLFTDANESNEKSKDTAIPQQYPCFSHLKMQSLSLFKLVHFRK